MPWVCFNIWKPKQYLKTKDLFITANCTLNCCGRCKLISKLDLCILWRWQIKIEHSTHPVSVHSLRCIPLPLHQQCLNNPIRRVLLQIQSHIRTHFVHRQAWLSLGVMANAFVRSNSRMEHSGFGLRVVWLGKDFFFFLVCCVHVVLGINANYSYFWQWNQSWPIVFGVMPCGTAVSVAQLP